MPARDSRKMVQVAASRGWDLASPFKAFEGIILHFDEDGENADGGQAIGGRIEDDPVLADLIERQHGH